MALSIAIRKQSVFGDMRVVFADVTFDASYVTGGLSLVPKDLGISDALSVRFADVASNSGLLFEYDHTNQKLKAMYPTGGATAPAALAAPTAAAGATAVTSSAATAPLVAGQGREVANATNLSAVTCRAMIVCGT